MTPAQIAAQNERKKKRKEALLAKKEQKKKNLLQTLGLSVPKQDVNKNQRTR